jgi:hypothetical protein
MIHADEEPTLCDTLAALRIRQRPDGYEVVHERMFPCVITDKKDGSICTITGVETMSSDGGTNYSAVAITVKHNITVGLEKTSTAAIDGTLSAGLCYAFSTTVSETTEKGYEIVIPPHTEVTVTQRVVIGYMTYPNSWSGYASYLTYQPSPQYGFRVRLPNVEVRSQELTG